MYKKEYVLGFMISITGAHIAMVHKQRPDWQRGRWNGIGGHVEKNEPYASAMAREFKEETGVDTAASDWIFRGWMRCNLEWQCAVFVMYSDKAFAVKTITDEPTDAIRRDWIKEKYISFIENIPALVELCDMRRDHTGKVPMFVLEYI